MHQGRGRRKKKKKENQPTGSNARPREIMLQTDRFSSRALFTRDPVKHFEKQNIGFAELLNRILKQSSCHKAARCMQMLLLENEQRVSHFLCAPRFGGLPGDIGNPLLKGLMLLFHLEGGKILPSDLSRKIFSFLSLSVILPS